MLQETERGKEGKRGKGGKGKAEVGPAVRRWSYRDDFLLLPTAPAPVALFPCSLFSLLSCRAEAACTASRFSQLISPGCFWCGDLFKDELTDLALRWK